jgi:pSer/pThr/pTyr-binding forkhead associated (FHA) protein
MAGLSLIAVARDFFLQEQVFSERHQHPWIVWTEGGPKEKPINEPTLSHVRDGSPRAPTVHDPLAIEVIKGSSSAFPFGITIGRTENNDVVLRHEQVSRFHAFVQPQTGGGFALVDANSKNGTFVNGQLLTPSKPELLGPRARIGFGGLVVDFYEPQAFIEYLRKPR